MVRFFGILITCFIFSADIFAANFYSFKYKVENGDTFSSILKKFAKKGSVINSKSLMIKKTIAENSQIKDWRELKRGDEIRLSIAEELVDLEKFKNYRNKRAKENEKRTKLLTKRFKLTAYYMASAGFFNQKNSAYADINYTQNAPASIGVLGGYYPDGQAYSFNSSVYFLYLMGTSNAYTNQETSVPVEMGATAYAEYHLATSHIDLYSGFDFEKSSLFNLSKLYNNGTVNVVGLRAFYLTVGAGRSFEINAKKIYLKTSLSKTIVTSTDDGEKYSGYKMMFYLRCEKNERWYYHSLFKFHSLDGASKVTEFRVGVGIGYIFF